MNRVFLLISVLLLALALPGRAAAAECSIVPEAIESASSIRGLRVKRRVKCRLADKEFVEKYLRQIIKKKIPPQRIAGEGKVYQMLGLIPLDYDYLNGLIGLYTSQLGGYYDPEKQYYAMASWLPNAMQMPIAVHELTHALQDQHFGLEELLDHEGTDSDALLARSALVEGDATAVMIDFSRQLGNLPPLAEQSDVRGIMMQSIAGSMFSQSAVDAPAALRTLMMFPYVSGLHFSHALLRRQGYRALDAAFSRLPESTEQILHPELYGKSRKGFIDLEPRVPEGRSAFSDAQLVFSDRFGEFFISTLLGNWISPATASRAAAGWGGDRVALYTSSANRSLLVWQTAWDSKDDAVEFFDALAEAYQNRFTQSGVASGNKIVFATTEVGRVEIARDDSRVTLLLGL